MILLAADIGGTKTILHTARLEGSGLTTIKQKKYRSADYPRFEQMLQAFISEHSETIRIKAACFGLAGPIEGSQAKVTNLPWLLSAENTAAEFNIEKIRLINDFVAIGYGVPELQADDLITLQAGQTISESPKAIIGAGTGLGEALLTWCGQHYQVMATEGGHAHFAPTNSLQAELLQYLLKKYDRVSNERILSGQGILNIFEFLQYAQRTPITAQLHQAMQRGDASQAISTFAVEQKDQIAEETLRLFCEIYGQTAGDLALTSLAHGGVYIAGGIAAKNREFFQQENFLNSFNNKGRMTLLMTKIPVYLVLQPTVGLIGAMQIARQMVGSDSQT